MTCPMAYPIDSPTREPTVTATTIASQSPGEVTAVEAMMTSISPGTMSPRSTLVSSKIATLAPSVRASGSRLAIVASAQPIHSFNIPAS